MIVYNIKYKIWFNVSLIDCYYNVDKNYLIRKNEEISRFS